MESEVKEMMGKGKRRRPSKRGTAIKISVKARGFVEVKKALEQIREIKDNHPETMEVDIEVVL